ncbi:MAG TPA: ROK family protein [Gaiellaceae bacterium]|nr:ROK family protein [Gaiellaceae bacterium]
MRVLGLDLGATNIKLAVLQDGSVAEQRDEPTRSEDGDPERVLRRLTELGRSVGGVDSIGVALPGLFDDAGNAVLLPNLYGDWTGVPVRARLEELLDAPVHLVNDGHAFALAESMLGAGRGASDVMCVVCGTGVGGGLVLGGRLHLGVTDRGGELGHHTVDEKGPKCPCGNCGCLELYAGARAIAAAASAGSFDDAVVRAKAGDDTAVRALARAGELVGLAVANVLIFLAPERVVVGGGVTEAGELFLGPLRASVAARARVAPLERIEVVQAELGPRAGAIGAALWGRQA